MGPASDVSGQRAYKKTGSVGVVTQAPLTHDYTYMITFADGSVVRAAKSDLSVRRSDAPEDGMPAREISAFEPLVIYKVRMGSNAFGLANENSDTDERGIFLPPAEWHWSLQPLPEQIEFKRLADGRIVDHNETNTDHEADVCWWELEKFLRLALKANPNVLEALFVDDAHVLHCSELAAELRQMRGCFLSKYLYQTYSGYVLSQFKKMKRAVEMGEQHRPKHASHLIRLLYSGIEAVKGNGILVDVGPYREELLRIKHEALPFAEVYDQAVELTRVFEEEYSRTTLPDLPDIAAVDQFLIKARRSRVAASL